MKAETKVVKIETLKQTYVDLGKKVDAHYNKINNAMKKCNGVFKAREGYDKLHSEHLALTDFMKQNNINFYTNYGEQTINF